MNCDYCGTTVEERRDHELYGPDGRMHVSEVCREYVKGALNAAEARVAELEATLRTIAFWGAESEDDGSRFANGFDARQARRLASDALLGGPSSPSARVECECPVEGHIPRCPNERIYKAETGGPGEKLAVADDGREVKRREAQPAEVAGSSRSPSASPATSLLCASEARTFGSPEVTADDLRRIGNDLIDAIATPAGRDFRHAWDAACVFFGRAGSEPALLAPVEALERLAADARYRAQMVLDDSDRADGEAADDEVETLEHEAAIIERCANAIRKVPAPRTDKARTVDCYPSALEAINSRLGLQACETNTGTEVKCWPPDPEDGGLRKAYLDASDCRELSAAFATLAALIERRESVSRSETAGTK